MICKGVAISIPVLELHEIQETVSIDNLMCKYYKIIEEGEGTTGGETEITLETEFMVHCSNLQAWAENGYDTRLLHSNLAFPLLKRLNEAGDLQARKIFKEEIVKRYLEGNRETQRFLTNEEYLNILTQEERQLLFKKNIKELYAIEEITRRTVKICDSVLLSSGVELLDGIITGLRLYGEKKLFIPVQIGLIKSLKKLILKEFINKEMPQWVGKLSNIEYLDLSGNFFEEIPDNLEGLINLKYIDLGHNKLKNLPKSFSNLINLEKIVLSGNRFEVFPKELLSLNNLHTIKMYKNHIKLIPTEIKKLRNLYDLNVSNNPINFLPNELFSLPQLERLSLPNTIKISKDIKEKIINKKIPLKIFPKKLTNF